MAWYTARLLFRCVHGGTAQSPIPPDDGPEIEGEETVILLECDSQDRAMEQAQQAGKQAEHEYQNRYGERVTWAFVKVLDVCEPAISDFKHGTELYSRFLFKNSHE